ncbi:uncharacterized protein LOC135153932 [Lytechinus pictus]|uniref:uncharacterized protein LOC135153932 n=1 Tax=Lytechinus pictus TaxID=7653 RepID=UPI0030BA08AF
MIYSVKGLGEVQEYSNSVKGFINSFDDFIDECNHSNDTILLRKPEEDRVITTSNASMKIDMTTSDSLQEKFEKLNIEGELQLSFLAGMVNLSGSGSYIKDEKTTKTTRSMSLIYKLKTINEKVMLAQNKDIIDNDKLSDVRRFATHVVIGIDWGAICTVTCEYTENKDVTQNRSRLDGMLKMITKGQGKADKSHEEKAEKIVCSFRYNADTASLGANLPVTFGDAIQFAQSLPTHVQNTNDGKGVPLTYHIMPLEFVRNIFPNPKSVASFMFSAQEPPKITASKLDKDIVRKGVNFFDKLKKKHQIVNDIYGDLTSYEAFISDEAFREIDVALGKVEKEEESFKSLLQEVLKKVRAGEREVRALEEFENKINSGDMSTTEFEEELENEFKPYLKEVEKVRSMERKGIKYIGKKDELPKARKQTTYILYITRENDGDERKPLQKNTEFFMRLQSTFSSDETCEFFVVDQEIVHRRVWPDEINEPTIEKYVNGVRISADLYDEEGQYFERCMAQVVDPVPNNHIRFDLTLVKLRCPKAVAGNGRCTDDPSKWTCLKCKELLKYGTISKLFYCKCGESKPKNTHFRCNDPIHGMHYVEYQETLQDDLSKMKAMPEITVLILGEVGSEKSNWINALRNFMLYPDFDMLVKAINSGYLKQKGEEKEVQEFTVGRRRYRLINTPGICNTFNPKQDEINAKRMLNLMEQYSEINAICILLQPDSELQNAKFRFYIQEFLAPFPKSAEDNIVFCFAGCSGTSYDSDEFLHILNEELRRQNVTIRATEDKSFCLDSNLARILSSLQKGNVSDYSAKWEESVAETGRLFEAIEEKMKPHKVTETVVMDQAREIILATNIPLVEVAKLIKVNVLEAEEITSQLVHEGDLTEHIGFKVNDLKRKELDYPNTVCTGSSCVKFVSVGQTKRQHAVYEQICHKACGLKGVQTGIIGDQRLRGCLAMGNNELCRHCHHRYEEHMHITYEFEITEKEFLPSQVQDNIRAMPDIDMQMQAFLSEINTRIEGLKEEQKTLMEAAAQYASFLKANALIVYNDAVGDYLEMCIHQEAMKPDYPGKEDVIMTMQQMKNTYGERRTILDNAIDMGGNDNKPDTETSRRSSEEAI